MSQARLTKVSNQHVFGMLLSIAKSKKITVCESYIEDGIKEWPLFVFNPKDETQISGQKRTLGDEEVTLEEMIELLENYDRSDRLELTSDYTAVINRGEKIVEVGCQKIPFDKVNELFELVNKGAKVTTPKKPTKFKVKDKVKIIGNSNGHGYDLGSIHTITDTWNGESDYDGDLFKIGWVGYIVRACDLELIKAK